MFWAQILALEVLFTTIINFGGKRKVWQCLAQRIDFDLRDTSIVDRWESTTKELTCDNAPNPGTAKCQYDCHMGCPLWHQLL